MLNSINSFTSGWFLSRSRTVKRILSVLADVVGIVFALWLSFSLRFSELYIPPVEQLWIFLLAPVIAIPIFIKLGLYRAIIRYIGLHALGTIFKAISLYILIFSVLVLISGELSGLVPRTVYGIDALILLLWVGGTRLLARWWFTFKYGDFKSMKSRRQLPSVIVYGAGIAGIELASALNAGRQLKVVGFIDDDSSLHNQIINGLVTHSIDKLDFLIEKYNVRDVLLAMPSISRAKRNEIIQRLESYPVHVKTLPALGDLADGKVTVSDIQEVDIADLLGREAVEPIDSLLHANITDKVVMVTGAGGSIGSELCRQIARLEPKVLILYELNEFSLYTIEKELEKFNQFEVIAVLGSVQNQQRLEKVCQQFNVETIYHAAAYKHVPLVEQNITEGVQNNIFGTLSCANAAINSGVETFVLISTDKAVRPTNTMGATKRFAELVLQALAEDKQLNTTTRFTMVRFGNVLGSSGSVVPLFRKQIAAGGPITVTDEKIIRYFMTIPEAAELVIQAGAMGHGGDVFVLDMGEPVRILDLAKRMIHLSGYTEKSEHYPDGDIEITFTGLRSGEKLFEELLIGDNVLVTAHRKIMRAQDIVIPWAILSHILSDLQNRVEANQTQEIRRILVQYVDGFTPQCDNQDWLKER